MARHTSLKASTAVSLLLLLRHLEAAVWPCTDLPEGQLIFHPYDCQQFYECLSGNKVLRTCSLGHYFNYYNQTCSEDSVGTGCPNTEVPTICYATANETFSDPCDCTKYVNCYNGNYYSLQCPIGQRFDNVTQSCVNAASVPCSENCQAPLADSPCFGVSAGHVSVKPYVGYCRYYHRCLGEEHSVGECPTGMYYNESNTTCDFEEHVSCTSTGSGEPVTSAPIYEHTVAPSGDPRCADSDDSLFPTSDACSTYIECNNGVGYELECPSGMYFSEEYWECVDPRLSDCDKITDIHVPAEVPAGFVPDPECPFTVAQGRLLPQAGDCTKYYECVDSRKTEITCPEGLWWHQLIGECDYPYLSNCVPPVRV